MPPAGNKRNDWVLLAFYDDKVKWITITGAVSVCRATRLFGKQCSQRIKLEIFDALAWINHLGADVCANE